jgi:putative flippase GtrA
MAEKQMQESGDRSQETGVAFFTRRRFVTYSCVTGTTFGAANREIGVQALQQQVRRLFSDQPVDSVAVQVPRALIVSVLAALLDVAGLFLLVEMCGWQPVPAAVVSYLAGGVLQYVLCSWWVFPNSPNSVAFGFVSFTVLSLVGLALTWAAIATLHDYFRIHYGLAKIFALGLAFTWNFTSRKFLIFRPAVQAE